MGSYDNKRQEAWDRLGLPPYGKEHQALLRDELPVSLENMPRIVADEVYKWFWEVYGELLLAWCVLRRVESTERDIVNL